MSNVCELIVVRHGETVWNADGRQQGHLDSPLSETGIRQAEAISEALSREPLHALYSSSLGRAHTTAEYIAERCGVEIVVDDRLKERHLGVFQGLTMAEVKEKHTEVFRRFASGDPDYEIPGGESARQRHDRNVAFAEETAPRHAGERVVVVTHGGALGSFMRHALRIPLEDKRRFKLYNASINTFFVEDGKWMLGTWGDIHHLEGIGSSDDW